MQRQKLTLADRFSALVEPAKFGECLHWTGAALPDGRGRIFYQGKMIMATKAALIISGIDVPAGMFVCHKCDNPRCVKASHLFVGTAFDNMRDASNKGRIRNQQKTHCPSGHPLSGDNLKIDYRGNRRCLHCYRSDQRKFDAKRRSKVNQIIDATLAQGKEPSNG